MADKVWSDGEEQWVPATMQRLAELKGNQVKAGNTVALPPITHPVNATIPLPEGVEDGDTLWMEFNAELNLDRARAQE